MNFLSVTGELYAAAALDGSITFLLLSRVFGFHTASSALWGFLIALALKSLSILFGLRLGSLGNGWIRFS